MVTYRFYYLIIKELAFVNRHRYLEKKVQTGLKLLEVEKSVVKMSCNVTLPVSLFRGIPVFAGSPDVNNDEID